MVVVAGFVEGFGVVVVGFGVVVVGFGVVVVVVEGFGVVVGLGVSTGTARFARSS